MNAIPYEWPLWMQVTECAWRLMWRVLGVLAVSAAVPAGLILGFRLLRVIRPMVAQ